MTQDENVLLNKCRILSQEISRVGNEYNGALRSTTAVVAQLAKAANRSKEYENGTFIVLVVGPVKSGKSTLVNLIANAYVSPTHFLECTVRPSIISQRRDDADSQIAVYTSEDTADRIEQIDAIVDCIRGIESEASLGSIRKAVYELTPENIKAKVELGLNDSLSSETLVTSITTPGGRLMKKDVFIVDMPGFDGEYANIGDPVYDTIAQRADLIIFVQSSNSAISNVSGQFLKKLAENNKDVPVCLIHNVFDSSWWRSAEERTAAARKQKEFAISEIRKQGFNIDESQCFSINLGKVEDSRKQAYADIAALSSEAEEYDRVEGMLYDRIINRRDTMRLKVCLGRTRQQLKKTIEAIDAELADRQKLTERYEGVKADFGRIGATPNFASMLQPVTVDYTELKHIIRDEARRRVSMIGSANNHNTDKDVTRVVTDFVEACEKAINDAFRSNLSLNVREKELFLACKDRIREIRETASNCDATPKPIDLAQLRIDELPPVSLKDGIDLKLLIPHKLRISVVVRFGGHSASDIVACINKAATSLAGSEPGDTDKIEGYIEKEGGAIKPILSTIECRVNQTSLKYETICEDYLRDCREAALGNIIADKAAFDAETALLKKLKEELAKINSQI